ncbi:MAG: patatin-like phospholipase family protein [Christensenellales bacterium]
MKLRDIFRRGEKKTKNEKAIERQLRLERKDRKKEEKKRGKIVRKAKVALCLGGGGARGYAHIGAIKAFREAGFDFDLVVGTSVGSIIGGLYAAGISPERMWSYGSLLEVKDIRKGFFFNRTTAAKSLK